MNSNNQSPTLPTAVGLIFFFVASGFLMRLKPVAEFAHGEGTISPGVKFALFLGFLLSMMGIVIFFCLLGGALWCLLREKVNRNEISVDPRLSIESRGEPLWSLVPLFLGLGFAATSWVGLLGGALGFLGPGPVGGILAGILLVLSVAVRKNFHVGLEALVDLLGQSKNIARSHPWLFYFVLAYLSVRGLQATLPQTHGDPLYYHLASAWHYQRENALVFAPWAPWFLQGGLGELVYSMIGLWSGERMLTMVLAQGLHCFFAYGGTLLLVMLFCRDLHLSRLMSLLVGIGAISFPSGQDTLICAKNDGFVLFFILLSFLHAQRFLKGSRSRDFYLALLVGSYAFSLKFTAVFYLIPLAVVLIGGAPRALLALLGQKKTLLTLILCLWLASPNLVRNGLWTQNPFFPAMPDLFPSPFMDPKIASFIKSFTYTPGSPFEILWEQLSKTLFAKVFFILAPLGIFSRQKNLRTISWLIILAIGLLGLVTGRGLYARFSFFIYPLMAVSAGAGWVWLDQKWGIMRRVSPRSHKMIIGVLFVAAIGGGQVETSFIKIGRDFIPFWFSGRTWHSFIADVKPNYSLHRWINNELREGRIAFGKILSFGDNESFFLDLPLSVPENEVSASQVVHQPDMESFVREFDAHEFTYLQIPKSEYTPPSYGLRWLKDPKWGDFFKLIYESQKGYTLYGRTKQKPSQ